MKTTDEIFSVLRNQLVWSVRRGYAGFLTLEFGKPHIQVRNPIDNAIAPSTHGELPSRRRAYVYGQWSLFVSSTKWVVHMGDKMFKSKSNEKVLKPALEYIDGQKLKRMSFDAFEKKLLLQFDLGGIIEVGPDDYHDEGDRMWIFNNYDEGTICWWSYDKGLNYELSTKVTSGAINDA